MIKTSIELQDLRRKIYIKAKAEKQWRFWGLYVHVCKKETLREAYKLAKHNKGAPGIDGVTFEMIESAGVEQFLENIQTELQARTYYPERRRIKVIPKDNGNKMRKLSIPTIKDRVVEGALKLILEPIFEADFQPGSYGYRPKRTAAAAIEKVTVAAIKDKTRVIDVDLRSYFNTIAHLELFNKIAERVNDKDVMKLLKLIVKAGGKRGISQGGPLSPLLSNIYLNEVDKMLERAKSVSKLRDGYDHIEYVRWADDLIILIDGYSKWQWLERAINIRLRQELLKIKVELNEEKTKTVDLKSGETFSFLGFDFRRAKTKQGKIGIQKTPRMRARTALLEKLKEIFRKYISQPVDRVTWLINPILRGWINYFRIGNSSRCFGYVRDWVEKKVRRHLMKSRGLKGFGWERWSRRDLYEKMGLYNDYQIRYYRPLKAITADRP
ncbi:MAG: group II intron reverse transcriptase/maturase [Candidatus Rickettsia vulgarisii]